MSEITTAAQTPAAVGTTDPVELPGIARTVIYLIAAPLAVGGTTLVAQGDMTLKSVIAAVAAALSSLAAITAAAHMTGK